MKNYGELAVPAPVWQHGEVAKLRAELATSKQALEFTMLELQQLTKNLSPLCPCPSSHEAEFGLVEDPGPQQECPIHGDGDTFVTYVHQLEAELAVVKQALRGTGAVARGAEQDAFEAWLNVGGS